MDPELGDRLRAGTLDRQASGTTGFGDVFGLRLSPPPEDRDEPGVPGSRGSKAPKTGRTDPAATPAQVGRLRRDRDAAAREAQKTREAADALAERVAAAGSRLRELEERHREARTRAAKADSAAARARAAFEKAEASLGTERPG